MSTMMEEMLMLSMSFSTFLDVNLVSRLKLLGVVLFHAIFDMARRFPMTFIRSTGGVGSRIFRGQRSRVSLAHGVG